MSALVASGWLGAAALRAPQAEALATPSASCTLFASVFVYGETPRLEGRRVWTTGGFEYRSARYCYPDLSGVYTQTKACGVFGCNWQTRDRIEYTPYGNMRETPGMDCRKGTNRYRTHSVYGYRVWGDQGLEPGFPIVADSGIQPEFSCK